MQSVANGKSYRGDFVTRTRQCRGVAGNLAVDLRWKAGEREEGCLSDEEGAEPTVRSNPSGSSGVGDGGDLERPVKLA